MIPPAETTKVRFTGACRSSHAAPLARGLRANDARVPSNAGGSDAASVASADRSFTRLGAEATGKRRAGQTPGSQFAAIACKFLSRTFPQLAHRRPGESAIQQVTGSGHTALARFERYSHPIALDGAARGDTELVAALGDGCTIAAGPLNIMIAAKRFQDISGLPPGLAV
jgi:hypothetical protein